MHFQCYFISTTVVWYLTDDAWLTVFNWLVNREMSLSTDRDDGKNAKHEYFFLWQSFALMSHNGLRTSSAYQDLVSTVWLHRPDWCVPLHCHDKLPHVTLLLRLPARPEFSTMVSDHLVLKELTTFLEEHKQIERFRAHTNPHRLHTQSIPVLPTIPAVWLNIINSTNSQFIICWTLHNHVFVFSSLSFHFYRSIHEPAASHPGDIWLIGISLPVSIL